MVVAKKCLADALNARTLGSGEITLVLSHGYGADQTIWEEILPDLAERCRVVLFNWDFSGGTAATSGVSIYWAFSTTLIDLMDEMALRSVVFVGHSMAGMIGCIAAAERPDLFRRLVLLGASPRYLNSDGYEGGFEMSEVQAMFTTMEYDFHSWARTFAGFGESLRRMSPGVALALAKAVFLSDLRAVLSAVNVPCTVINGTRDAVRKLGGEASLVALDFDGHFPQLTAHHILLHTLYSALGL
ncbi:unnamed protein product [Spirodela intermedia]|uniref:AB hydrolase-1 domain-containing protein n=1 Tax=Spirodela intermedia TaxID=51605 RepID=A0A7I8J898_SPIIN|nr:unnamed protein product [Spirodela intermedia]CAA6666281.1 unnamed protein product [Spirodela intermedia]